SDDFAACSSGSVVFVMGILLFVAGTLLITPGYICDLLSRIVRIVIMTVAKMAPPTNELACIRYVNGSSLFIFIKPLVADFLLPTSLHLASWKPVIYAGFAVPSSLPDRE